MTLPRPVSTLIVTCCVTAMLPAAAPAAVRGPTPASATATKKLPACRSGVNKKRCRCPKGKTLVRSGKGYRCVRKPRRPVKPAPAKPAPASPPPASPSPAPSDPGTPAPGPPAPPAGAPAQGASDKVRNDQALVDALKSATFYKTYNGGAGYGSYAYNFLTSNPTADATVFALRYCTYYVSFVASGSAQRENFDGAWRVKEGYTFPSAPDLVAGVLQLYRPAMGDQVLEANVGVRGNQAQLDVGNGAQYFEGGTFSYRPGQATSNCAVWEPDGR